MHPSALHLQSLACMRGGKTLFTDLSVVLEPGHLLRITGSNGAGKSSLLRMLCGLLTPSMGSIQWEQAQWFADIFGTEE